MNFKAISVFATLWVPLLAFSAAAQSFSIDWFGIAPGGGISSGGSFTLSGVTEIGEGLAAGGPYTLTSTSFDFIVGVDTPGTPQLTIAQTGPGMLAISWPSALTQFELYQNSQLALEGWALCPVTPLDDGTTRTVILNSATGAMFYRLQQ